MARIHLIRSVNGNWETTFCGLEGCAEGADEFSTALGFRFEALSEERGVTCKRCIALVDKAKRRP